MPNPLRIYCARYLALYLSVLCKALWVNPPLYTMTPQLFPSACRYSVPGEGKDENLSYYRPEESAVEALLGRRFRV
jgi:hypothetical protein